MGLRLLISMLIVTEAFSPCEKKKHNNDDDEKATPVGFAPLFGAPSLCEKSAATSTAGTSIGSESNLGRQSKATRRHLTRYSDIPIFPQRDTKKEITKFAIPHSPRFLFFFLFFFSKLHSWRKKEKRVPSAREYPDWPDFVRIS